MAPADRLVTWAVTVLILVTVPGPSVVFTINRALTAGRRTAVLVVAGNAVGAYLQVVAVAFGVGVLVERSVVAFTVIKFVGAAYVMYLGVQMIRHRRSMSDAFHARLTSTSPARSVWDGFVVGVSNPKSIAFFVVALPGFVNQAAGHASVQILILGALFPIMTLIVANVWALVAGAARDWFARSPRRLKMIGGGGLVMVGLGASLAFTGRNS
ncbi:MAG: LysE family translocator [Streptosporangiaceae bacterium]